MSELKLAVRELRKYLEHGESKRLARKCGIKIQRAYRLLQGRTSPTEADHLFIMACYDKALPRKRTLDKLKTFTQ